MSVSLKRRVAYGLLGAFALAAVLITTAAERFSHVSFVKSAAHKKADTYNHFKERLLHLNQDWEEEAMRTKTQIELTKYLEDSSAGWAKLNAYLLAQSGMPQFQLLAVTDADGSVLFRFGPDAEAIPAVITQSDKGPYEYFELHSTVYRIFRLPVWTGNRTARLILFKPFDNGFLMDMAYPGTELYVKAKGRIMASSAGSSGIVGFQETAGDVRYEQFELPLNAAQAVDDTPLLIVRTRAQRLFSTTEVVVSILSMLALLAAIIWLLVGRLVTMTGSAIAVLEQDAKVFSKDRTLTPEIESSLLSGPGRAITELQSLSDSLHSMMSSVVEYETELNERAQALKRSNEELERFAFIASHDLQEPLRKILSFTELLQMRYSELFDENARRYMGYISEGAERMRLQIRDLLAYSRLDVEEDETVDTDLNAVLQKVLKDMELTILETEAVVTCSQLPVLKIDETRIGSVFQNIIGNALKFRGKEAPRIHISAEESAEEWTISVSDNGIGIEPDYFERIFDMFQKLHPKSEYPGTGIGLALCKKIVQRSGGRISVESAPAKGSVFYISLPKEKGA